MASYDLLEPFDVRTYQSFRMIVDLGDWSKSLGIYPGGQSGQPFSKHWGDMFPGWQQGSYNPMLYTTQEAEANQEGVLTLNP